MPSTPTSSLLVETPAVELRRLIGARQLSPVELLDACIARIEALNPFVNAVTATCFERARAEALKAEQAVMRGDALGLLHGLPLGVKDLEPTAGLLSTSGSPPLRNHVPSRDIELVARLRQAGAIVVGKTNVPEMGAGANSRNPVWGATGNPFNPDLNAGGSSGGSAAALALDMLPVCTGSDTGGSLRIPAACCGVVGFRPSPGVIPSVRKALGWSPISVVGPMGRTVDDACLQMAASAGMHPGDPLSHPLDALSFLDPGACDLSRLRVAYGWQKARNTSTPQPLTNSPRHLLKVQWSDTLALGAWGTQGAGRPGQYAVEAIGVGARATRSGARLPGTIVTNLVYTQRFADVDVSMGVYNLFNHRHADPASYEIREESIRQDGRTYRLKLTYAF